MADALSYYLIMTKTKVMESLYENIKKYVPSNFAGPLHLNKNSMKYIFIKMVSKLPEEYGIEKIANKKGIFEIIKIPLKIFLNTYGDIDNSFFDKYWNNMDGDILFSGTDITKCNSDKRNFIIRQLLENIGHNLLITDDNGVIVDSNTDINNLYFQIDLRDNDLYYGIFLYPECVKIDTEQEDWDSWDNIQDQSIHDDDDSEKSIISEEKDEDPFNELFRDIKLSDNCKSLTMVIDDLISKYSPTDNIFEENKTLKSTDNAFIIDSYVRALLGISQDQRGTYITRAIDDYFTIPLTYIETVIFHKIIEKSGKVSFNTSNDNYLDIFDMFAQHIISYICILMKKAMDINQLKYLHKLTWIFHLDFDVKVDNSIDIGRIVTFDYMRSDNKVLISVKPFNI